MAVNAAFVAVEFALVAVDRTRVDERAAAGDRRARRLRRLVRNLSFHLSGAQVGITVSSLLLGFLAEPTVATAIAPLLEAVFGSGTPTGVSVIIALAVATAVQMVMGELVPKTVATSKPYGTAVAISVPTAVYGVLVKPFVLFLNGASNMIVRRMGVEPRDEIDSTVDRDELKHLFESSAEEGELDESEVRLLTKTIRLADKRADEAMVPRVEVAAVRRDARVTELVDLAVETGHSRFPVITGKLDDVVGVVHVKTVYRVPVHKRADTDVAELMTDVLAVPESRDLDDLLHDLRGSAPGGRGVAGTGVGAGQMAVVIDEHGGMAGIITLEDVLEEIVGEIDDEYDTASHEPEASATLGPVELRGSLHTDEVLEASGFTMPEGDYETLAGLVLDRLGAIPQPGETVSVDGWTLQVVEMDRLRIAVIRLIPPASALAGVVPAGSGSGVADAGSSAGRLDSGDAEPNRSGVVP